MNQIGSVMSSEIHEHVRKTRKKRERHV